MITEYWAYHYDDLRREGRSEEDEHEDEEFDLAALQAQAEAEPDEWVAVIDDKGTG